MARKSFTSLKKSLAKYTAGGKDGSSAHNEIPIALTPQGRDRVLSNSEFVSLLPNVICPFCTSSDVGLLVGKIAFSATISDEKICNSDITLAGFICANSHMFFVRESDIAPSTGHIAGN